jgi:Uma2 family endonuclease
MTVEDFRQLEERLGVRLELHHGEVVEIDIPVMGHWRIQERVRQILAEVLGGSGVAGAEFAFPPLPEHELWAADVAWVSCERYERIDDEDNLSGAPDIVVEVLSSSDTPSDILDKKALCLDNGCVEFWLIDPEKRIVEITHAGTGLAHREEITFRSGSSVTVGSRSYAVDDILRGARSR